MKNDITSPVGNLNLDSRYNIQEGEYPYALNAIDDGLTENTNNGLQNEFSNEFRFAIPQGSKLVNFVAIKKYNIAALGFVCYDNGNSEICEIFYNAKGEFFYSKLVDSSNLGITSKTKLKSTYKLTDNTVNLYFVDGQNEDRVVVFDVVNERLKLQNAYKQIQGTTYTGEPNYIDYLDLKKIKQSPDFEIYDIEITPVDTNGKLTAGVYQFAICLASREGVAISDYTDFTNPLPVKSKTLTVQQDYETSKAIRINVPNIANAKTAYGYYNIVVAKTVNNFTTFELLGTYPISNTEVLYVGNEKTITLPEQEVLKKKTYFKAAKDISKANNVLFKSKLSEHVPLNLQAISLNIDLFWATIKIKEGAYKDPSFASKFRSVERDEVQPYGIKYHFSNGDVSETCVLVGKRVSENERTLVNIPGAGVYESWQVYNNAKMTQTFGDVSTLNEIKPYAIGTFSSWESEIKYPNNTTVFGALANQKISFPKFPDANVAPLHDNASNQEDNYIYPLGVYVPTNVVENALNKGVLDGIISSEDRARIIGYSIVRANRYGNKSILAKGLFYDMNQYTKDGRTVYFSNFPFNDKSENPYLTSDKDRTSNLPFTPSKRYTFHSPNTSFNQPTVPRFIKVESESHGKSRGFFSESEEQSKHTILTDDAFYFAESLGSVLAAFTSNDKEDQINQVGASIGGSVGGALGSAGAMAIGLPPQAGEMLGNAAGSLLGGLFPKNDNHEMYQVSATKLWKTALALHQAEKIVNLLKALSTPFNYHVQYQAIGKYNNQKPVVNKVLNIENASYLRPDLMSVEDEGAGSVFINNYQRESSVYLKTTESLPENTIVDDSTFVRSEKTSITVDARVGLDYVVKIGAFYALPTAFQNTDSPAYKTSIKARVLYRFRIRYRDVVTGLFKERIIEKEVMNFQDDITFDIGTVIGDVAIGDHNLYVDVESLPGVWLTIIDYPDYGSNTGGYYVAATNGDEGVFDGYLVMRTILSDSKSGKLNVQELPKNVYEANVSSFYGSLKSFVPNQYGQISQIEFLSTGGIFKLGSQQSNLVFGGDTFINRFWFKRKAPLFINTAKNLPTNISFYYEDLSNLAYTKYFFNTGKSASVNYLLSPEALLKGGNNYLSKVDIVPTFWGRKMLSYQIPKVKLDDEKKVSLMRSGCIYTYVFGMVGYIGESDVNVDYRHAENNTDKDFYPHSADLSYIFQDKNIPFDTDNFYGYNTTFSKQNRENKNLNTNIYEFRPEKYYHQNSVIYSQSSNDVQNSNSYDPWLIFKPLNYHEFDYDRGELTSIQGIENDKLFVRFKNSSIVLAVYDKLSTDNDISSIQLDKGALFSQRPMEFSVNDRGLMGSRHSTLLRTDYGHIYIDEERLGIFLIQPNAKGFENLASEKYKCSSFFKQHLGFHISKFFSEVVDTDDIVNGIGYSAVYDGLNKRFLLTKKDYILIDPEVKYNPVTRDFYKTVNNHVVMVSLLDERYFKDVSWTMSFSFKTVGWKSFHSYKPNLYLGLVNSFISSSAEKANHFYEHSPENNSYQTFYDNVENFEIESISSDKLATQYLYEVEYNNEAYEKYDKFNHKVVRETYDEVIVYNQNQTTGVMSLVVADPKNRMQKVRFPLKEKNKISVLVHNVDNNNNWRFNTLRNVSNVNQVPILSNVDLKQINPDAIDIIANFDKNQKIQSQNVKVLFIKKTRPNVKIVHRFTAIKEQVR